MGLHMEEFKMHIAIDTYTNTFMLTKQCFLAFCNFMCYTAIRHVHTYDKMQHYDDAKSILYKQTLHVTQLKDLIE